MALDLHREIASLRNRAGDNWIARALQKIADHANALESRIAQANRPASSSGSSSGAGGIGAGLLLGNNGLPLVDLADPGHGSKHLDAINDGVQRVGLAASHASGNVAYNFRGVWSSANAYVIGDEVVYGPTYWVAVAASANSQPSTSNANWQAVGSYSGFEGAWSSTTAYVAGAEVTYSGNYWVATQASTNQAPAVGSAYWQIAGPTNLDQIANGPVYARTKGSELDGSGFINPATAGNPNAQAQYLGAVTGTQRNLVPDSDLKFGTTYAVPSGTSWPIVKGGGLNGGNAFSITGTGAQIGAHDNVWTLPFVVGQTYILSGNCRISGALSGAGTPRFLIYRNGVEATNIHAPVTGGSGRYSTGYTVPSGTTSLQLIAFSDTPTVPNGVVISLDSPQWENGNVMTKYVPNVLDDTTGGLASGIPVQEPGGALSPVVLGDAHQRARTAIDSGFILAAGSADFSRAYLNKHLGNIPDDAGSSRYAVLAIDANRRPIIDGGSAHVNWTQDHLPDGTTYARTAGSQLDANGIVNTIGYSGHTQMTIGQGTIALTTGGASAYQVKKTLYTAPTGTEANGTVISFSSLTDQAGNALPTFDTPPLVALYPYNMSTPPVLLYASGMTTTGFVLNSYSAATSKSGPSGTLVNGTDLTLTADAGTTFTGVMVTCSVTTKNITPYHPNVVQTFAIAINDVSVGTITVSGAATGAEYQKSQNFSISGNPTSVKVSATWTLNGDASSASATVTSTEISNPTAVSANTVCAISELWN